LKNGKTEEAAIAAKLLHGHNHRISVFSKPNVFSKQNENSSSTAIAVKVNFIRQYWLNVEEIFNKKHIRIPTLHLLILYWNQNLSGALVMLFYTTAIFQQVGVPANFISIAIVCLFSAGA
jgi:hypothetical protein